MLKLSFEDEGVLSCCEQDTTQAVDDGADPLIQQGRLIPRRADTTIDQQNAVELWVTRLRPPITYSIS